MMQVMFKMECDCGEMIDYLVCSTNDWLPHDIMDQSDFVCEKCDRSHWINQEVFTEGEGREEEE